MSKVKKLRVNKKLGIIILITVLLIVIVFRCAFLFKQSFSANMVNAEQLDSMNDCLNTYIHYLKELLEILRLRFYAGYCYSWGYCQLKYYG